MVSGSNIISVGNTDPFDNRDFNNLFKEMYTPLCRYSMKFVLNKDVAEDIVQDIFLYLWENRERLTAISSIKSYAFRAVKHKSLSYIIKQFQGEKIFNYSEDKDMTFKTELPDSQEWIESKELESIIEKALDSLPVRCCTIFKMKRFGDLSNKEIAGKLHISVKTVEAQMTIALRKLTNYISERWS